MNSFEIRKKFLDYFEKHGHTIVSSSSLIPAEDPTLLFTNAGMNQFKDLFLGKEKRSYKRATTIQKCVRAGGKHNDLDQVGYTDRHLTFFEMMGNFSFGDYFKKESISYAWEFLTKEMGLPAKKLWASVFKDDSESYNIWQQEIGLPENRIVKLDEKDNFWAMGDTGPCGPCTEIYLDRGENLGCKQKDCQPGCDCKRFIEIWNNVFMQYDRHTDGTLNELAQTGVDTGMGFERLCMVTQGKNNIFEIDLFKHLIEEIEKLTGLSYNTSTGDTKAAFHVLSDHIRTSSLLIADGCSPANDGRGYVLRKIIRRAALFAQKLSDNKQLFSILAKVFIKQMSDVYPELKTNETLIINILNSEIERFATNLISGQNILHKIIEKTKQAEKKIITGKEVFKLYDTYGFPYELTRVICQEDGLSIDIEGFEKEMKKAKALSGKKMKSTKTETFAVENLSTKFVGYEILENKSKIQLINSTDSYTWLSTEESPFFVECGGQVGDQGWVTINNQTFKVIELKKTGETFNPVILVKISNKTIDNKIADQINIGDIASSTVDKSMRLNIVRNHTATHMLQAALVQILGPQVKQAGSIVNEKYLRFDYTHHKSMSQEESTIVEDIVNKKIWENIKINISHKTLKESKADGIISFFGEKYNPEDVRIVDITGYSKELCGGTHADRTGSIGCFKIISDTALATGVRRIVALTGQEALKSFRQSFNSIKKLSEEFKAKPENVVDAVKKQQENLQQAISKIKQLKKQLYNSQIPIWQQKVSIVGDIPFLLLELEGAINEEMKNICQQLSDKKPGFYVVISKQQSDAKRFSFMAFVSKDYTSRVNLKKFASYAKENFGIKGGGSPTLIQGGGTSLPDNLKEQIIIWIKNLS